MTERSLVFEQLNPDACRTYLVACRESGRAALIDPVLSESARYLDEIQNRGLELQWVIDTHTHADHLSGATLLAKKTGAEYAMHKRAGVDAATHRLTDGSRLQVGDVTLEALETPGHTKDSLSFVLPGRVLTGDWLFVGGAGRTDLPGGDPGEHWDALSKVIPKLDEEAIIFPGHDYQGKQSSPLAEEKEQNMNLSPRRSREAYVAWLHAARQETPEWMIQTIRANNEGALDPSLNFMPADASAACMCQPVLGTALIETQPEDVKAMIDRGHSEETLLLDVRQPEEFTGPLGHVPGTTLIPLGELSSRLQEIDRFRDKTVIAICKSGGRSARACEILMNAGFSSVLNLAGGTQSWNRKGFPVER